MRYVNYNTANTGHLPSPASVFDPADPRPLGAVTPISQADGLAILRENADRIEHTADIRVKPVMTFAEPLTELFVIVSVAQNLEASNRQPCIRFYREGGKIVGVELAESV